MVSRHLLSPKGQARYDKILDIATEIFFELGYEKCSLNDIVKRAGGSLATIYKYFESKEKLLLSILDRKIELFYLEFRDCEKFYGNSMRENLTFFAKVFLGVLFSKESILFYRIIVAECAREGENISKEFYENGPLKVKDLLIRILKHHAKKGELNIENYEYAADRFIVLIKEPYHFRLIINVANSKELLENIDKIIEAGIDDFLRLTK